MKKDKNSCCNQHPDHSKQLSRLNRASGQIEGVKRMIKERKYCPDIITQLQAVRSAIKAVEANILDSHISECVRGAVTSSDKKEVSKKIEELIKIYKKKG